MFLVVSDSLSRDCVYVAVEVFLPRPPAADRLFGARIHF